MEPKSEIVEEIDQEIEGQPTDPPPAAPASEAAPAEPDYVAFFEGDLGDHFGALDTVDQGQLDALKRPGVVEQLGQRPDAAQGLLRNVMAAGRKAVAQGKQKIEAEAQKLTAREKAIAEREGAVDQKIADLNKLFAGEKIQQLLKDADKPDAEIDPYTPEGIKALTRRAAGAALREFTEPLREEAAKAQATRELTKTFAANPELKDPAFRGEVDGVLKTWATSARERAKQANPQATEAELDQIGRASLAGRLNDAVNAVVAQRARAAAAQDREARRADRNASANRVTKQSAPTKPTAPTLDQEVERLRKMDSADRRAALAQNPDLAAKLSQRMQGAA